MENSFRILAHIENMSLSRLSHSLFNSMEDLQLVDSINSGSHQSSLDDDERASSLPTADETNNKCSIEILMLVFYGGKNDDIFLSLSKQMSFVVIRKYLLHGRCIC